MSSRGQAITSHPPIVLFFIRSLTIGGQSNNNITSLNIRVINNIRPLYSSSHSRINDNGSHQITHISRFPSSGINMHSVLFHFSDKLFSSVDNEIGRASCRERV